LAALRLPEGCLVFDNGDVERSERRTSNVGIH
jgi:hypothetical protein